LLSNHTISVGEECIGNRDAEHLGSPKIEREFEMRRELDWEISWRSPFKNLVHVARGALKERLDSSLVGEQAARFGARSAEKRCRDAMMKRQARDAGSFSQWNGSAETSIPFRAISSKGPSIASIALASVTKFSVVTPNRRATSAVPAMVNSQWRLPENPSVAMRERLGATC